MDAKHTWGFLGCGHLAQALIGGAKTRGLFDYHDLYATNRSSDSLAQFSADNAIHICTNNQALLKYAEVVVLGTKPQDLIGVLKEIGPDVTEKHLIISLAAGVSSKDLLKAMPKARSIFRVMANTPALVQKGLFGIYPVRANDDDRNLVIEFFSKLGAVTELENDKQVDALTSASASGVGFVLFFMEVFEKWLLKKHLSPTEARRIVIETFSGTAELARREADQSLLALREQVTSKKGTTFAGLNAFKKSKVAAGLQSGLESAMRRALELSKELRFTGK